MTGVDKTVIMKYVGIKVLDELRCQHCKRLLAKHVSGSVEIKCHCGLLNKVNLEAG